MNFSCLEANKKELGFCLNRSENGEKAIEKNGMNAQWQRRKKKAWKCRTTKKK